MMKKWFAILAIVLVLQGCGAVKYVPEEYPINNERIPNLVVKGSVVVKNLQNDQSEFTFVKSDRPWLGSLKEVSEALKQQLEKEIKQNSTFTESSATKSIKVKVLDLDADHKQTFRPLLPLDFFSEITLEFQLGNGFQDKLFITNKAPSNYNKVLNGAIALGVIEILKHPEVRRYLNDE